MKILCDVCEKNGASVFCAADEAALCFDCDRRVHHANKLAGKHQRFSIERPSSRDSTVCDICKERRAFLFCQQDRAILCRDCDVSIHRTNKHTQMHTRFLLIGLRVSSAPSSYSSSQEADSFPTNVNCVSSKVAVDDNSNANLMSASNISDHLLETVPGWQFEDYFIDSSPPPYVLSEELNNEQVLPMMGTEMPTNLCSFTSEELGFWVPQSTLYPTQSHPSHSIEPPFKSTTGTEEHFAKKLKKRWIEDCCPLVPDLPECFQVPASFFAFANGEKLASKKPRLPNF